MLEPFYTWYTGETMDLNTRINQVLGHHRPVHYSRIERQNPVLLFQIPNRKGFMSIEHIRPGERYDVYHNSVFVGRIDYDTIRQKFGGNL